MYICRLHKFQYLNVISLSQPFFLPSAGKKGVDLTSINIKRQQGAKHCPASCKKTYCNCFCLPTTEDYIYDVKSTKYSFKVTLFKCLDYILVNKITVSCVDGPYPKKKVDH